MAIDIRFAAAQQHLAQIFTTSLNVKFLDADHECFKYSELTRVFETAPDTRRAIALLRNTTAQRSKSSIQIGFAILRCHQYCWRQTILMAASARNKCICGFWFDSPKLSNLRFWVRFAENGRFAIFRPICRKLSDLRFWVLMAENDTVPRRWHLRILRESWDIARIFLIESWDSPRK